MMTNIRASFMQPIVPATASAVMAMLQPRLQALHAAGDLYAGDVIVCADMHFRIAQRIWHIDQDKLGLEIVLLQESWCSRNKTV